MRLHRITTPEQVHFHYRIAGLVTRGMAWSLDQLIVLMATVAAAFAAGRFGSQLGTAVLLATKFVLDFGYYIYYEMNRAGQTPGKKAFGIRVISSHGGKLSFSDVLTRTLFRVIDSPGLIPFFGLIGGITAIFDSSNRRLGDLAADTIVVRDVRATLPKALLSQQTRVNSFQADPQISNRIQSRVTRQERDLMLDLMSRRDGLDPVAREALFYDAAAYFRHRYQLPDMLEHLSDEQTVINLALVIQGTQFTG